MLLKLTGYVRITISLLYKPKILVKFRYLELFKQNFQFWPIFHWKSAILSSATIMTSLWRDWRLTWDVGTYFDMYGKKRHLDILWYQLDVSGGFIFKLFTRGWYTPPWVRRYKKSLVRRGLRQNFMALLKDRHLMYYWMLLKRAKARPFRKTTINSNNSLL